MNWFCINKWTSIWFSICMVSKERIFCWDFTDHWSYCNEATKTQKIPCSKNFEQDCSTIVLKSSEHSETQEKYAEFLTGVVSDGGSENSTDGFLFDGKPTSKRKLTKTRFNSLLTCNVTLRVKLVLPTLSKQQLTTTWIWVATLYELVW